MDNHQILIKTTAFVLNKLYYSYPQPIKDDWVSSIREHLHLQKNSDDTIKKSLCALGDMGFIDDSYLDLEDLTNIPPLTLQPEAFAILSKPITTNEAPWGIPSDTKHKYDICKPLAGRMVEEEIHVYTVLNNAPVRTKMQIAY